MLKANSLIYNSFDLSKSEAITNVISYFRRGSSADADFLTKNLSVSNIQSSYISRSCNSDNCFRLNFAEASLHKRLLSISKPLNSAMKRRLPSKKSALIKHATELNSASRKFGSSVFSICSISKRAPNFVENSCTCKWLELADEKIEHAILRHAVSG